MNWTKTGWTKMNWTKSGSTVYNCAKKKGVRWGAESDFFLNILLNLSKIKRKGGRGSGGRGCCGDLLHCGTIVSSMIPSFFLIFQ